MAKSMLTFCFVKQLLLFYNQCVSGFNILDLKGNLPDPVLVSKFLNEFIGVLKSIPTDSPLLRTFEETEVEKVIREKIQELQPFLQDNEQTADTDNLLLDNNDETTIIEFLPKTDERNKKSDGSGVFKTYVKRYKKLKERINKALTKESVSEKTKHLVIKTLDELMNSAVKSQCKWKRNLRAERNDESSSIADKWNRGLKEIRKILLNFFKYSSNKSRRSNEALRFVDALQILFRSITEDIEIISKRYKILCDFVPKHQTSLKSSGESNASALRNNWDKTDIEEDRCFYIVICSNELAEFLQSFYNALNDTAVSVLSNYVEMYTRDVSFDNENEKHVIISLLNKITKDLCDSISKIFIEEVHKLKLDKYKNRHANIKALSDYIKNSVESVKTKAKQHMKSELLMLREKVISVIIDDLNVNLDVDLGNLEREFIRKICHMFRLCNGKYRGRRLGSVDNSRNNVYVQVQLTLDDDMTNLKSYRKFLEIVTPKSNNSTASILNAFSNITVTRTTLQNY